MKQLEKKLSYTYNDIKLLKTAMTHSSYANENKSSAAGSNERLEFLGDSVLGMIVAEGLYRRYPDFPEGKMTRLRAELVCEQSLVEVAKRLGIGRHLRLGRGEESGGGRERPSILADAVEALLASLYIDGGFDVARAFVEEHILASVEAESADNTSDYKTALQEVVQRRSGQHLSYRLVQSQGPDHDKVFLSEVLLNDVPIGRGEGKSKKESEQAAAKHALGEYNE